MSLPIEHLSYSSLKLLCSNPWLFKKQYIMGLWDFKQSPSAVVGSAFHRYAEHRYNGNDLDSSIDQAMNYIQGTKEDEIEYGKTGSREKMINECAQVIGVFEMDKYGMLGDRGDVVKTEHSVIVTPQVGTTVFPLPIKARTDLITKVGDTINIFDWKVVASFTEREDDKPAEIMQAMFNYFTVKQSIGEPESITFVEIKKSLNKDKSDQIRPYTIYYSEHPEYFKYFAHLYTEGLRYLDIISELDLFLPNFDGYDAMETWRDFVSEVDLQE